MPSKACCVTIDAGRPGPTRLFIALWPGEGVRRAVHAASRAAVDASGGRAVPRANYHLTLVFLGDQPCAHLPRIQRAMAAVEPPAGLLRLDRFGTFGKARVLWLGPEHTPPALTRCVRELRRTLRSEGVEWRRGAERFRAHVTLARRIHCEPSVDMPSPVPWHYGGFSLVMSERAQSRYRVLENRPCPSLGGMK